MSNVKKATAKIKQVKITDKHQIAQKLETALAEVKAILGEKKFNSRIKKAGKIIGKGLHKAAVIQEPKKKPAKASEKAVAE